MNGFGVPFGQAGASVWAEHQTPDGRLYYYNSTTKVTQWTKPEDLMSSTERALAAQPWKEYTAEGGRKYWYNGETKQSSWEMPEAYKKVVEGTGGPDMPVHAASHGRENSYSNAGYDQPRDSRDAREPLPESRQLGFGSDSKIQSFVAASNDPEYASFEEAEAAFMKLLRRSGVQSDWTWEKTIRATAKDPQYRAIKDPRERRLAFDKYCRDILVQEKERVKERLTKLRGDFETMLKRHPEITHYTRWKTARPMIEGETIFRNTDDEDERQQLFEEYIYGLKKTHRERQSTMRKSAMDGLVDLLPQLNLEPYTRWSDAKGVISSTQPFQLDEKYQSLSQFEILTAFQNHMKALERAFNDSRQQDKNNKQRKERKARDGFKSLLNSLRKEGKINAGTKWSQIIPLIENDERYVNMAGQGGSSPQELFWDIVEEEERGLRVPRTEVLDVLEDKRFDLTPSSDLEEFLALMKDDKRTANFNRDILTLIFERLREKRASRREEDRHLDRNQRRAVDNLRGFMRHLDPPIASSDTYEKVRPRLLKSEEFEAVSSEDARRSAFDKHIRRLKEKEDEPDRKPRRHDRVSSERDMSRRDSERPRGERPHRPSGRPSRRSRSPEPDAYEADRRKAIAERERNHRKSAMAENLLSVERGRNSPPPPRRERERERERDREPRDYDRPPRSRRDDDAPPMDRDRRERDEDRSYRRRVERNSYDELPYGDERPSASRRRRPDDEDDYSRRDSRDSKRMRRERSRERSPPREARHRVKSPVVTAPPPKDVRSGSEEGEIEE